MQLLRSHRAGAGDKGDGAGAVGGGTEPGDPPTDSDSPSELMPVVEQPLGTLEQTNAANEAACVPTEDQTVEMLDPLVIAEIRVEPVTFEAVESDGARVEETTVPGFVIPEQTVNVGCIIHERSSR